MAYSEYAVYAIQRFLASLTTGTLKIAGRMVDKLLSVIVGMEHLDDPNELRFSDLFAELHLAVFSYMFLINIRFAVHALAYEVRTHTGVSNKTIHYDSTSHSSIPPEGSVYPGYFGSSFSDRNWTMGWNCARQATMLLL
ncbi:uncharacterized protein LOC129591142 [Paramacrobiotus metropolitanus]|uniref:uncharacterized protein LOC129591142 n=1 Tax=Paramacrobiotus metropolitanus TaxID=2943436 RepID=UPI002446090F|nr:uncharacterized protein LOC129591142 [Paramacrobiotus metropolitanus]